MMQRRTLQACSLKHSIKKTCFSVQGKIEIILVGQGQSPPPPPPPPPFHPLAMRLNI